MSTRTDRLEFGTGQLSVTELLGSPIGTSESTELLDADINLQGQKRSVALNYDYLIDFDLALELELERPSLGEFEVDYPVLASLDLPDSVEPGELFSVGTQAGPRVDRATLAAESLNFGELGLNLNFETDGGYLNNISFGNVPFT